ncbi:MAG: hypothetical protein HOH77_18460, partial [Candidatus Latescibacteria bacterium]|nr:hypothetical protein [Candidatus Latescibacterota bacterium]
PLMDRAWNTRGHWMAHNLVWRCEATMKRCVLYGEKELLCEVIERMKREQLIITTEEGIQCDFSFHQHKSQLYNGGYGLKFQEDMPWWLDKLRDTPFAFSSEDIQIISSLILEGTQWMTRGEVLDYACQGRNNGIIPHAHHKAKTLIPVCEQMMAADPEHATQYQFYIDCIQGKQTLSGNRHFWRSDFMAHHRPQYYTSVRMFSTRTVGFEIIPKSPQGKRNAHRSDGITYIIRNGQEYAGNVFPTWNWRRLPGTTTEQHDGPFPWSEKSHYIFGQTAFVGAASDGTYGVAGYDFLKPADIGDAPNTVQAKKAYFYFDDEFVCLGAGITGHRPHPINTTLNQCQLTGEIHIGYANGDRQTVQKETETVLNAPQYIWHDQIGYVFPEATPVNVLAKQQTGRIVDLFDFGSDEWLYEDIFCLYQDHGVQPTDEHYQYIVVPSVTENELRQYVKTSHIQVISNTETLQAVCHDQLGVSGIVFYQPGHIQLTENIKVSVDHPCIALIREMGQTIQVALSNPENTEAEITLQINNHELHFFIPSGQYAGQSIIQTVTL